MFLWTLETREKIVSPTVVLLADLQKSQKTEKGTSVCEIGHTTIGTLGPSRYSQAQKPKSVGPPSNEAIFISDPALLVTV
ncbi:unnamed protein product [Protopolystoma xenopodis]|uniref:Uncharacterized protein n=1 Tax=Protopolystoma xenopodis TaxID=117903 RepID=A0A448WWQ5_9PLAT|nr:unnamed protein product [Protopolystoma xenopodis]